ncbi:hypothetical protein CTRI78_v011488 [Colletotrichum trifolii]|uniref:Uncharacterized protein n=1 Tax=Colletotrichum trifolii TaxID=5466 RepID=A0A4R8Q9Q8_COLTR|nr:hypothetical protein CTRI78_v011488 [Colletotrichum trifolii]
MNGIASPANRSPRRLCTAWWIGRPKSEKNPCTLQCRRRFCDVKEPNLLQWPRWCHIARSKGCLLSRNLSRFRELKAAEKCSNGSRLNMAREDRSFTSVRLEISTTTTVMLAVENSRIVMGWKRPLSAWATKSKRWGIAATKLDLFSQLLYCRDGFFAIAPIPGHVPVHVRPSLHKTCWPDYRRRSFGV